MAEHKEETKDTVYYKDTQKRFGSPENLNECIFCKQENEDIKKELIIVRYCQQHNPKTKNLNIRTFETGATRDIDKDKYDYEGFLSPLVLERYAEYMHKNRVQSNGTLRDSDNWQKGIPLSQYMKSLTRHFMEFWKAHRIGKGNREELLCAIMFNTMGYLFELLKEKK